MIANPRIYNRVKKEVFRKMPKPSAVRSSVLVREYKKAGGTYTGRKPGGGLSKAFKEDWAKKLKSKK